MKLYSLLNENHVLIDSPATTMAEALDKMLKAFGDALQGNDPDLLLENLLDREHLHPTIIAEQVCLPHIRLEGLDRFLVGLMVPEHPIPHVAQDHQPISIMFVILAPQNKNTMMLQTLAAIARLLQSKKNKQAMLGLKSATRLIRLIEESGVDIKKNLIASDIMSPITHRVAVDTVLAKAVDVLVDAPDEGIPVLNDKGALVGELTSSELLTLGMPKYLDLIVNPTMLDNFEPFENFFQHENNMSVRELCRRDIVTVEPGTSVVHVTHLMMTRHKRRIYVAEDGELKGVIYRKNIITRVLHL